MADRANVLTIARLNAENEILRETLRSASDEVRRLGVEGSPPTIWSAQLMQVADWMETTADFRAQAAWVAETQ